jgi:hypothetical protein
MAAREDTAPAVDWGATADPILATPPWRLEGSRQPQVIAATEADPHKHDWAGPGFTKPGPESDACYQTGYTLGKADALAGPGARAGEEDAMTMTGTTDSTAGRPATGRPRLLANLLRRQRELSDRLHASGDARAASHGWTITRTRGAFGFGARTYRDPRFDRRH